jgi:Skp family chaperone for outer membrane proteins
MFKLRTVAMLFAAAITLGAGAATAQTGKIGVINMTRIEKESPIAIRAEELLKQEFESRRLQADEQTKRAEAARDRLQKEQAKLSPTDARAREREVAELLRKAEQGRLRFVEELEGRKRELRVRFFQEVDASIKLVAEAGGFDLIVHKAAFARPTVDVTPMVLKEMAKRPSSLK